MICTCRDCTTLQKVGVVSESDAVTWMAYLGWTLVGSLPAMATHVTNHPSLLEMGYSHLGSEWPIWAADTYNQMVINSPSIPF